MCAKTKPTIIADVDAVGPARNLMLVARRALLQETPLLFRVARGALFHSNLLPSAAPATASPCDRAIRPRARVLGDELALRRIAPLEIEACGERNGNSFV